MMRPAGDPRRPTDAGFTMLEVTIGMTIMSIFLAIFGSAMINTVRTVDRTQQTAFAQSAVNQVYLRLDRQIRSASGISNPGVDSSGNVSVEFTDTTTPTQICTQLQLTTSGLLRQRSWAQPPDTTATITMLPSQTLGADVKAATPNATASDTTSVSGPFATLGASGFSGNQRLEIALSARDTSKVTDPTNQIRYLDLVFTALNTGTSTSSASVCSAGRSISWSGA